MSFAVVAIVTDLGRQRIAQQLITGKSFVLDHFSMGSAGHDPLDPTTALSPDPTATSCPSVVFGPESVDASVLITPFCPQLTCRLEPLEAVAAHAAAARGEVGDGPRGQAPGGRTTVTRRDEEAAVSAGVF